MSLLGKIKDGIQKSGTSKSKILFVKKDSKVRVRMLQEIEGGTTVTIHDSFEQGINAVCREHFGEECPYCEREDLRHREAFVWSVWDHDAKEVKLFVGYANNFSPLPALIAMAEAYGNWTDRDYVINRTGSQTNTSYGVVPMDKARFKNSKAKPFSSKETLKVLGEAFPVNEEDEVKSKKKGGKKKPPKQEEPEDDDDYEDDETSEYEDMSPRELYRECLERGIEAKKKQKAAYYIELLEADDEEDDYDDDEDEWDDEDEDEDDEDEW